MLSQKYKLSRDEIEDVMKRGKSSKGRFLAVKYVNGGDAAKISVVVSKKVSKGATKRNKVKRRVREIARKFIKEGRMPNGSFVIIALPDALDALVADMSEDLFAVLNRSTA
ncbi:MAG: ribonuclease P protein component [Parcubacteria group bacterium]|nr:ribonuclease P protein component [Parcubacteria group bacterium]